MKNIPLSLVGSLIAASSLGADAAVYAVSQDGFIDQGSPVMLGGTSTFLAVATPNPSGASGYTRKAYFGFSIPTLDITGAGSAIFRVSAPAVVNTSFNGQSVMRFYLVSNAINDAFDETTLAASTNTAPGNANGDVLASPNKTTGTVIGEIAIGTPAAGQQFVLNFSAASIADLALDTNGFLTIVAEYRGMNNAGFGANANGSDHTGLAFVSKEGGVGSATLELLPIPEPSVSLLGGIGALVLLRRRRDQR